MCHHCLAQRLILKETLVCGTWVVQLVKCLTLDFGSGCDLVVRGFEPMLGSALTAQSLLVILSLPLSLSAPPLLVLSLKINK